MNLILSSLHAFLSPLFPWLVLAAILQYLVYRLQLKLWNTNHEGDKPNFWKTLHNIVDVWLITIIAGLCTQSFAIIVGVPIVSGIILLITYGVKVTKFVNLYLKCGGVNASFNLFGILKGQGLDKCLTPKE